MGRKPCAVYVTSPDYLGNQQDLAGLSAVCAARGIPLLVDNAHGAYLHFLPQPAHPLDLGATACCDSAHKTLPVLTGGAYLHIAKNAPERYARDAKRAMALFGSTSPSYLILQSLDRANAYLAGGYAESWRNAQGG
jgi:arginine/lysine/ornithine decarboxylase